MNAPFFSSKWYRVASLRLRLQPSARIHPQSFRGETWHVLQDPQSGRFHRLSVGANLLLCLLDGSRTVEEAWELVGRRLGADQPTQDETIRLLAQLHAADLLLGETPPDIEELARRGGRDRRRRLLAQLRSPLAIKVPIFDPDRLLSATIGLTGPLFTHTGFAAWLAFVTIGIVLAGLHWGALTADIVDHALAPSNMVMALFVFPVVKGLHELGHGWAVKRWGGSVHETGIMLLVLFPVPYVDASDAGCFRNKWQRAIVGAAGVMVELAVASFALVFWVMAENGAARALAFNIVLVAGVSTLFFNGNPLMRLDGYYVLSDLIEIPNLAQRSGLYLIYLVKRYVFGLRDAVSPVTARGERAWFVGYALASFVYRATVTLAIALFLAAKMFLFGVALALWAASGFLVRPIVNGIIYVLASPELALHRRRAITLSCIALIVATAGLLLIPLPFATAAEGVLWIPEGGVVRPETSGVVSRLLAEEGSQVLPGAQLFALDDPGLIARVAVLEAEVREIQLRLDAVRMTDRVSADMYREQLDHSQAALALERMRSKQLIVSSAIAGRFVAPNAEGLPGRYVKRGAVLGYVVPDGATTVRVLIDQDDADLVRRRTERVAMRFLEQPLVVHEARMKTEVPAALDRLPSEILGASAGGPWVVDPTDAEHRRLLRKAFLFEVTMDSPAPGGTIGGRVMVRFDHGTETLGASMARWLRQLFLRRLNV